MDPTQQDALHIALDRMWVQFLPLMEERIAILETAAAAFSAHQLTIGENEAARDAAHKLAGALGTFGLTRGTSLARELEMIYSRGGGPDPANAARLASIPAELRTIVANRK